MSYFEKEENSLFDNPDDYFEHDDEETILSNDFDPEFGSTDINELPEVD